MKFRNRLRRLEEMLRIATPPPPALLFTVTPDGVEMQTGPHTFERVTEDRMNQLCADQPPNAVVPMVIHTQNSRPATDTQQASHKNHHGEAN